MISEFVREQKRYTQNELCHILKCSEEHAIPLIRKLKEFGVLKAVKASDIQKNMADLLEEDIEMVDVEVGENEYFYVFTFVGVIVVAGRVLKCYPKYLLNAKEPTDELRKVIKVLEKYNAKEQIVRMFNDSSESNSFNLLAVLLFLLQDYFENDVYTNTEDIIECSHKDVLTALRGTSKYYGAFIGEIECYKANILNREVLSADTWTEKSILHRAEILADILIEEFKYIEIHSDTNESTELTFDVNSNFDFSNTKPGEMIFVGEHTKVSSWADLLAKTMNTAFDLDAETITDLATKDYSIPYATRIYISNDERKIRKPKQIDNSGIYFEANLSANGIISFIKDLLAKLQLDTDDFSFSLSEVPFDIDNEDTWAEGLIPVAKLFYNFVENLVEKELIDSAELENLKTKEYTKKLFQATDYPAIANNRTDNMGNSLQKRYRAKAINFNGSEIYVSTQFFDSDRDAVIDWYRSHL